MSPAKCSTASAFNNPSGSITEIVRLEQFDYYNQRQNEVLYVNMENMDCLALTGSWSVISNRKVAVRGLVFFTSMAPANFNNFYIWDAIPSSVYAIYIASGWCLTSYYLVCFGDYFMDVTFRLRVRVSDFSRYQFSDKLQLQFGSRKEAD